MYTYTSARASVHGHLLAIKNTTFRQIPILLLLYHKQVRNTCQTPMFQSLVFWSGTRSIFFTWGIWYFQLCINISIWFLLRDSTISKGFIHIVLTYPSKMNNNIYSHKNKIKPLRIISSISHMWAIRSVRGKKKWIKRSKFIIRTLKQCW